MRRLLESYEPEELPRDGVDAELRRRLPLPVARVHAKGADPGMFDE